MDEPNTQHFGGKHVSTGVGALSFEISHSPGVLASADGTRVERVDGGGGGDAGGITRLQSLRVSLDLRFVDERFGTLYASTGSSSLSHALQSRAYAEMSPQEYALFQREQMRLRSEQEEERPLPALTARRRAQARGAEAGAGAGAGVDGAADPAAAAPAPAAPRFVPNFEVRAPAAAAAPASSSSSSLAGPRRGGGGGGGGSSVSGSRSRAAPAPRPQWQDTVEQDPDDDGGFKF